MRAQDNGHLTSQDRRVVNQPPQNVESQRIYRDKHNAGAAYPPVSKRFSFFDVRGRRGSFPGGLCSSGPPMYRGIARMALPILLRGWINGDPRSGMGRPHDCSRATPVAASDCAGFRSAP